MKFILVESLEDELKEKHDLIISKTNELTTMFENAGFNVNETINGISFEKIFDNYYASFYIDSDLNYKGYVSDSDNNVNYSVKGTISDVVNAAIKLISSFEVQIS